VTQRRKTSDSRWRDAVGARGALDLPPDRAFVLHLDAHVRPPRRLVGRVEHVTSGRVAHVTSLRELIVFLTDVLRDGPPRGDVMADRANRKEEQE
jgi:hypothetical protein